MTHEELFSKYAEIMSNDALVEEFKTVKNNEEARAFLRANGLEADDEELEAILAAMIECSKGTMSTESELSDDQLEEVAGGGFFGTLFAVAKTTWDVGTKIAGHLVYGGSQQKAKDETIKFWKKKLGIK